jgi:uncharacterized membrane protein YhaH (DUF805 family)
MPVSGEVIYFDAERGIGFATGANGNRYVFGRSDLGTAEAVAKGARIAFRADGDHARDIVLASSGGQTPGAHAFEARAAPGEPQAEPSRGHGMFGYFLAGFTSRYADFRGRARRKEFWSFACLYVVLVLAATIVSMIADFQLGNLHQAPGSGGASSSFKGEAWITLTVLGALALASIVPILSLTVRRIHDIGLPGWFILLGFVPSFGNLIVFVFTLVPSQRHDNRWGPVPEGIRL